MTLEEKWAISCPHQCCRLKKHPSLFKPHLEWLLGEEEPTPVGTNTEHGLPPPPTPSLPIPPLPPEDPEPSSLQASDWIERCTRYFEMPPWWGS